MLQQGGEAGPARRRRRRCGYDGHQMRLRIGTPHRIKPKMTCHALLYEFMAVGKSGWAWILVGPACHDGLIYQPVLAAAAVEDDWTAAEVLALGSPSDWR